METFKIFMEKMKCQDYFVDHKQKKKVSRMFNLFTVRNWHYPYVDGNDSNQDISKHVKVMENFF